VGATQLKHIDDALAAVSLKLTPEEVAALEESYVPHPVDHFMGSPSTTETARP
jgi:aryl-alcohol dehydrogenase-like predicted oxidoreductase